MAVNVECKKLVSSCDYLVRTVVRRLEWLLDSVKNTYN